MSTASDAAYASHLLSILSADRARLAHEPGHAAIVLWMVEELRRAAASLTIERETSKALLDAATDAREAAVEARRAARKLKRAA